MSFIYTIAYAVGTVFGGFSGGVRVAVGDVND